MAKFLGYYAQELLTSPETNQGVEFSFNSHGTIVQTDRKFDSEHKTAVLIVHNGYSYTDIMVQIKNYLFYYLF